MSESIEHIRHSTSADVRQSIVMSTMEFLKSIEREDLCKRFANEIAKQTSLNTAVIAEDNLNEENMEVDDEQDDKHKKQLSISEYNDVDYRFLDQDMDHRMPTIIPKNEGRTRFPDVLSNDRDADDRTIKSSLMGGGREKRTPVIGNDSGFRANDGKITSQK
jgi:hypothetical protein